MSYAGNAAKLSNAAKKKNFPLKRCFTTIMHLRYCETLQFLFNLPLFIHMASGLLHCYDNT